MRKLSVILLVAFIFATNVFAQAAEPKVTIHYEDNAQFELISPEGTRVLIDVYDSSRLSSPAITEDLLLTTHFHYDHRQLSFYKNFPGQQLFIKTGELTANGVKITGIASAHNDGNDFLPADGSNYIFIIEMAGFRIVHFGDIGQNQLTPEQLQAIGRVDIALTQLSNSYSDMSIDNLKGFNLMDQVNPKLIIPTHMDAQTAEYAVKKWRGFYGSSTLNIGKTDLDTTTTLIMLGNNGEQFGKNLAPNWVDN
jgi:L-ascorbate metabolism protein UlaG (beta-lactamase superfamily)